MPDSETFDAFYARTVWNVTTQMHALAGDDGVADHAIREAYAKAYQQWYQVSGYPDAQAWVLTTAKDAYERRRAETVGLGNGPAATRSDSDSGTWPGFFRPVAEPARRNEPGSDADGAVAAPRRNGAAGSDGTAGNGTPWGAAATQGAGSPPGWLGPADGASQPTRGIGFDGFGPDGFRGSQSRGGFGRSGLGGGRLNRPGGGGLSHLATRRNLIVAGVAAALVVAVIAYGSGGGHKPPARAANQGTSAKGAGKPKPQMLAAGHTGGRSTIPWSLVGRGWALAESSAAAPNSAGQASGGGSDTTYLVDPEGGKYVVASSYGGPASQLLAWSGDGKTALFGPASNSTAGAGAGYRLLHVSTGHFTSLPLPAGVSAVGFTRPDGLAIIAVRQGPAEFRLQRYTLRGQLQNTLAVLPRKAGESWPSGPCSTACAISSPDGDYDVWGIAGDEMHVLSNAGGKATRLHVKDSGHPSSCIPVSWWNDSTILADCAVADVPGDASRLWLIPDNRSTPTALTQVAAAGAGHIEGAWQAGQTTYVTSVTSRQCQSAPSGPYGLGIMPLGQGSGGALVIPGATNNVNTVVATYGRRLLVLAQTSCPGTSSLFWFSPSAGKATAVLVAPASQAGVIAAVPYGNGPTALSSGQ